MATVPILLMATEEDSASTEDTEVSITDMVVMVVMVVMAREDLAQEEWAQAAVTTMTLEKLTMYIFTCL